MSRLDIHGLLYSCRKEVFGKYGVAELRKFVFEIGRTFGVVQYGKEAPLKTMMARDMCKDDRWIVMPAAPTGHSQSQGSVGKGMPNGHCMVS